MSVVTVLAMVLSVGLAAGLLAVGVVFMTSASAGFRISGHEEAALPSIMGGRYLGLGSFIIGLMVLGDASALCLAFAIGACLGFFDAVVTARIGGPARGHFVVGLVAAFLSIYYFVAGSAFGV